MSPAEQATLKVCMIGRPTSGKTTFLVALWGVAKAAGPDAALALRGALPPSTGYLDQGLHALLGAEPVRRTNRDEGEEVSLPLRLDGEPVDLEQLDVAGETVEAALIGRALPRTLHARIASADGLLLFVHPDDVKRPFTIPEAARLVDASNGADGPAPTSDEPLVPLDDEKVRRAAPTAVQLVDLLQISAAAAEGGRLPVAVVVSAWDLVGATGGSLAEAPESWLARAMPLLRQFLDNHRKQMPSEVFGVSAQGGDYDDPDVARALAERPVAERITVSGPAGTSSDIAEPLRWLLTARP